MKIKPGEVWGFWVHQTTLPSYMIKDLILAVDEKSEQVLILIRPPGSDEFSACWLFSGSYQEKVC